MVAVNTVVLRGADGKIDGRTPSSRRLKVAVGCEDGSLWIFAAPPPGAIPTPPSPKRSPPSISPNSPPINPAVPYVRSRHASTSSRPGLARQSSSTSFSRRNPPSPSPTSASFDLPTSFAALRPRKASATVSVSTTMGTDYSSAPLPAKSPVTSTVLPSLLLSSPSPGKRTHRARESVTSGIGLWEHESMASVSALDLPLATDEEDIFPTFLDSRDLTTLTLTPTIRVFLGGKGAVQDLRVLDATRLAKEEGGQALLVLRSGGHLSLHSLVDGRELGSCHLAEALTDNGGRSALINFAGVDVLQLPEGPVALCYGSALAGLVVVDLDTLIAHEAVDNGNDDVQLATIFKQGVHFVVFCSTSSFPPELYARPVLGNTSHSPHNHDTNTRIPLTALREEPPHSVGFLHQFKAPLIGLRNCADDLVAFDSETVLLFTIREQKVNTLGVLNIKDVVDVCVQDFNVVLVLSRQGVFSYRLEPSKEGPYLFTFVFLRSTLISCIERAVLLPVDGSSRSTPSHYLLSRTSASGRRFLDCLPMPDVPISSSGPDAIVRDFAEGSAAHLKPVFESDLPRWSPKPRLTKQYVIDREIVLLGYSSGAICLKPYEELSAPEQGPTIRAQLEGSITLLNIHELGGRPVVVAGTSQGNAGAWDLGTWQLIGQWSLFASPVSNIVYLSISGTSRFANTVAFISANSPVALVSLFPPQLHFVLPGTKSPVESISTLQDELLVVYSHGLARLCHVDDQDLRRSMDYRTATSLLAEGGWKTWFSLRESGPLREAPSVLHEPFLAVDLRTSVEDALNLLPWTENRKGGARAPVASLASCDLVSDTQNSKGHLGMVRFLLSHVLTFGIDSETDILLSDHLKIKRPSRQFGKAVESGALAIAVDPLVPSPWCISETATAQRLLQAVCLLRVFLNFPDTERYASQVILFYSTFLQEAVGPDFVFPSLECLADYWLDSSGEIQQTARLLFGTYLGSASDDRVLELVERWQDLLPPCLAPRAPCSSQSEKAVLLLGLIAAERFKLLSATVLKDIAHSITIFLDDDHHPYHQAIATELCLRGFEIWQNYVDAMPLVRQLFGLATGRNAVSPNELRALARLATLHVAGINVPLFMTTLSLDILNAHTAAHRNATMKLLGFMVRKKPLVLHASLPRLAEAVVKSLDPTITALRETVQQAATVILNELVRTYPSIDFHGRSQRLAVGTHEGAAIVYDLKTATRLYVLEGHSRAVTALSFSPDGRRLVSVSLAESKAVVWKVGVGILSMFNPGAPPRQGSGGTATPFKTIDFAVGDEAHMTTAATLEWVAFEWPGERTTRLKIRETTLTFNV